MGAPSEVHREHKEINGDKMLSFGIKNINKVFHVEHNCKAQYVHFGLGVITYIREVITYIRIKYNYRNNVASNCSGNTLVKLLCQGF